jgi:hypothetical protein
VRKQHDKASSLPRDYPCRIIFILLCNMAHGSWLRQSIMRSVARILTGSRMPMNALKLAMLLPGMLFALSCAAAEPPRAEEPRKLCPELTEAAIAAYRAGKFALTGRMIGDIDEPAPPGAHAVEGGRKLDGVAELLYLDCGKKAAYIMRRGAVADFTYWFGPYALNAPDEPGA